MSIVDLRHEIDSRAFFGATLVTLRSKCRTNETLEVHREGEDLPESQFLAFGNCYKLDATPIPELEVESNSTPKNFWAPLGPYNRSVWAYTGTSLTRKRRPMPMVLGELCEGGRSLMGEVPLYSPRGTLVLATQVMGGWCRPICHLQSPPSQSAPYGLALCDLSWAPQT